MFAVLGFLAAAGEGAVGFNCMDWQMGASGCGVLIPLPTGALRRVREIGLLEIICGCGCNPFLSSVPYCQSFKVD